MPRLDRVLVASALWTLALAAPSHAATIVWALDDVASQLTLAVPDQTVTIDTLTATIRLRNQVGTNNPWTVGNTAKVGGTLTTDYVDGVSIQFLSGDMFGLSSGSYRPNPAAFDPGSADAENPDGQFTDSSTAPGVFGAKVRATAVITLDAAYFNFTSVDYDVVSTALGVSANSFAANSLSLGISTADVAFDGLATIIGQPIPDSLSTLTDVYGTNTAAAGTITTPDPINDPLLRRLEIPVVLPLMLDLQGTMLSATASGTVVAYAYVPEPGTLLLLGGGLLALAARRRGPRAH